MIKTEYQVFVDHVEGRMVDELPRDKEYAASQREVGFWKRFQFGRMVSHARSGKATLAEYRYLRKHRLFYPVERRRAIL